MMTSVSSEMTAKLKRLPRRSCARSPQLELRSQSFGLEKNAQLVAACRAKGVEL